MASNFVQRHKKKTLAGALLFFFRKGRGIIPLLLVVILVSTPFIVPRSALLRVPGVTVFMDAIGISPASQWTQERSFSILKSALERAARSSREGSFWNSVFRRMASTLPSGQSSIALVVGGRKIADSHKVSLLVSKTKSIKDIVNPDEKGRKMEGVYLGDILPDYGQADMGDMDVLGTNTPYYADSRKKTFPTGVDTKAGFMQGVLADARERNPTPVGPAKSRSKTGRLSSFAWRNLSFGRHSNIINARIFKDGALFRLAETRVMTAAADKEDVAIEYQTAYTGATYDGTDVNADILQTDATPPGIPDVASAANLAQEVEDLSDLAKRCAESQADEGEKMSELADKIDILARQIQDMGKVCCCEYGKIKKWNGKLRKMDGLCREFNTNAAILENACQVQAGDPAPSGGGGHRDMTCDNYAQHHIDPCHGLAAVKCILCWVLSVF